MKKILPLILMVVAISVYSCQKEQSVKPATLDAISKNGKKGGFKVSKDTTPPPAALKVSKDTTPPPAALKVAKDTTPPPAFTTARDTTPPPAK